MKNKEAIRGIIPPTVTPLKKEEQLDRSAVRKLRNFLQRDVRGGHAPAGSGVGAEYGSHSGVRCEKSARLLWSD